MMRSVSAALVDGAGPEEIERLALPENYAVAHPRDDDTPVGGTR